MRWDLYLLGLIFLIGLLFQPVTAQNYELSFDIKGYWYPTTAKLEIYVEDQLIKTFRATDFPRSGGRAPPIDPMHVVVDLGDAYGKRVKIRYVSLAGGGWILLDNVTVTKNGSQLKVAPWTINTNPPNSGIEAKKIFGREKRLVFIEVDSKRKSGSYAEFISQPITDAPELEIKPSFITFNPETPYDSPTSVSVSAKVRNVGSLEAENVKLELWINDKKVGETESFSVPSGGEVVKTLGVYDYRDGVVKVEVRVVSSEDVLEENNRAVRFLVPAYPYMLFSDVSEIPIVKYKDVEPYKSWRKLLIGRANSYLDDDLTYASYKGRKILALAFAYLLTGDEKYAEKAAEALLTAGKEVEDKTIYGGKEHIYLRAEKNALYYALAFDFLREYLYKTNKTQYHTIESKLAEIAKEIRWKVYIYHVYNSKESLPREGNLADPNNHMLVENPILVVVMSSLLGYNGEYLDYLNPYLSIRDAMKNLFFESITGAPYPAAMITHLPGGFTYQGQYRGQYAKTLAIGVMTYHKLFGDDLINDLARGIFDQPVWHSDPTGGEPNNKGLRSGGVAWHEQWITVDLYKGQDKLNHQWYINHVLMKKGLQAAGIFGDVNKAIFPGIFYDYTLPEDEPKWNGTYSYFSKANAKAIFRNGRDGNELWLKLYGHNHPIWSSATTSRTYHGAYSIWAYRAYLVVDRGDERGWKGTEVKQEGGFGFSSFIFNDTLVPSRWKQFGKLENPSLLTDYFISKDLESATVFTKIKKFRNVETKETLTLPEIKWNRTVIFPKDYFVILDELKAEKPYKFQMTIQYGGTEADTSKEPRVNYPVKGILKIGGKVVDWWNKEPFKAVTNFVSWTTESLTKVSSRTPLYTNTHWVELDTFIAPACEITYDLSGMQYGSRGDKSLDHLWHPFIKAEQIGKEVKYITVHYPRNLSKNEAVPSFRQLEVEGDGYAVEVLTEKYRDLIHIADGKVYYENVVSDAKIAFARFDSTNQLKYVYLEDFRKYTLGSKNLISSSREIPKALLKYEDGKAILTIEGDCEVTIWLSSTAGVKVKKNGKLFANWEIVDRNHIKIKNEGKASYEITYNNTDTTPPITSYSLSAKPSESGIFNTSVVVTFSRYDDSGVAYTNYSINSQSKWIRVDGSEPFEVVVDSEGTTKIYYYSVDVYGNREDVKSLAITIDRTPPSLENIKINRSSSLFVEIELNEPAKAFAEFGNEYTTNENYTTHHAFEFNAEKSGVLKVVIVDRAGNVNEFEKEISIAEKKPFFDVKAPAQVMQGDTLVIEVVTNLDGKLTIVFPAEWGMKDSITTISGNYTAEFTVPKVKGTFSIDVSLESSSGNFSKSLSITVLAPSEPWQRYDFNGDGKIDYMELTVALKDWINKEISDKEFINVLVKYSKTS
ncbi:hypothetical protein Ferp_1908 [Ferroglobus placidus DSM 10642]|uniref:EF-hand domain-containing protein n=1 Tax=Ferroglobus placidus (strain DSM 10642 / AEDII12DO) TaxID=589924 RepID=D3RZY5_FERPA|nr:CARDB domain-containing protein [Ferroglobus placidus]ADC66048.1 hypothetical protein Ferp_1908 [Ferroglobus placidus DSM 10642]